MVENLLSLGSISLYLIMVLSCVISKSVFCLRAILSTRACDVLLYFRQRRGNGGEVTLLLSTYVS